VQLAKRIGAEVTAVDRADKLEMLRSIGADHVIDYAVEDYAEGESRYDLILDIGGNSRLSQLRRALTHEGTLVIVGGEEGGSITGGFGRQIRALVLSLFVKQSLTMLMSKERYTDLEALCPFLENGQLTPVVNRVYPLTQVSDAMRQLEEGTVRGKIAIAV
jgi:NADPH:quinone reductase-like Zn-dependent oxidoreductase